VLRIVDEKLKRNSQADPSSTPSTRHRWNFYRHHPAGSLLRLHAICSHHCQSVRVWLAESSVCLCSCLSRRWTGVFMRQRWLEGSSTL